MGGSGKDEGLVQVSNCCHIVMEKLPGVAPSVCSTVTRVMEGHPALIGTITSTNSQSTIRPGRAQSKRIHTKYTKRQIQKHKHTKSHTSVCSTVTRVMEGDPPSVQIHNQQIRPGRATSKKCTSILLTLYFQEEIKSLCLESHPI